MTTRSSFYLHGVSQKAEPNWPTLPHNIFTIVNDTVNLFTYPENSTFLLQGS